MEVKPYNVGASVDFMLKHMPTKNWDALARAMRVLTGESYDAKKIAMQYLKRNLTPENLNGEG